MRHEKKLERISPRTIDESPQASKGGSPSKQKVQEKEEFSNLVREYQSKQVVGIDSYLARYR